MNYYYIYGLQSDGVIFYIGKTKNQKMRLSKHKTTAKLKRTYKENYINKLLLEGKEIVMTILETVTEGDEDSREIYWISYYKSIGVKLCNGTSGGEGGDYWTNRKHSEETKDKIRETVLKKISENKYKTVSLPGTKNGRSKLNDEDVIEMRKLREEGYSYGKLSKKYMVSRPVVIGIIKREKWKHI